MSTPARSHRPAGPPAVADPVVVRALREVIAARLEQGDDPPDGVEDERARAARLLSQELAAYAERQDVSGGPRLPPAGLRVLGDAVWSALYGLGPVQQLLELSDVENIHIHGFDLVALEYADGSMRWWPHPVAESDADWVQLLASAAARMGQTPREFSRANPLLNLHLPTGGPLGCRLAATMEVSGRPRVAIRLHRVPELDLDGLVATGTATPAVGSLLRAAMRAGLRLVVSGGPGAGKTTIMRVLAHEIDPIEHLVTVEEERELGLHLDKTRHPLVTPFEVREANAEGAGEVTMDDLLWQSLRHCPSRVIVGEVRGGEVTAMLRMFGNGAVGGGMCTLHAGSAAAVFTRIASLAQLADPPLPVETAYQWTASAIDLIVHVQREDCVDRRGRRTRRRFISEIVEVGPIGDSGRPDATTLFEPGPDGAAVPAMPPSPELMGRLSGHGFDWAALHSLARNGTNHGPAHGLVHRAGNVVSKASNGSAGHSSEGHSSEGHSPPGDGWDGLGEGRGRW